MTLLALPNAHREHTNLLMHVYNVNRHAKIVKFMQQIVYHANHLYYIMQMHAIIHALMVLIII